MKKLILGFLLLPVLAMATITAEEEFALNRLNAVARKHSLGTLVHKSRNVAVGKYSYAVQGGAVGNIILLDDLAVASSYTTIPDNAVIQNVWVDVLTQPTGSSLSDIRVELVNDADLKAGLSIGSFTGILQGIPDTATVSDWIKLTADKQLNIQVAAPSALTAGKFNVYVEYILGD